MPAMVYDLTPKEVPQVNTKYRRIRTKFPVPESMEALEKLREYEPVSMSGQPLVVWDRGEGVNVYDKWGNMWLDFSSGVLVTSAGHGRKEIIEAIVAQARHGLLHNYCFPSEMRARLAEKLVQITPEKLSKAFLLTTGSETTECAVKLARTYGQKVGGKEKIGIISFEHSFHGRTLGAQMIGGIPALKEWVVNLDPDMHQVPFPDGFRCEDTSFDFFLKNLEDKGVTPERVAGVITESYQGGGASFPPPEYIQSLARWCEDNQILLIMDEIQAAFGRTGTMFGFEHYGVVPDLICCGKAISSSLPVSAVVGRGDVMDLYAPRAMTSTHTGNPVCVAAALASIEIIERENLAENAREMGEVLQAGLAGLKDKYSQVIGAVHGKGLVAGLHMVKAGSKEPYGKLAFEIVGRCVEKGLLMFAPVGFGGGTVKISPPLVITQDAVSEGVTVLDEAIGELLAERRQ
ncbi:MAG: 4-aminobutyrate aminotransferase [Planctomycetes bacterium DG_23]|nr:MAG: 4-aminobutyrate aminotransferase [Planctomycetes bacterium DG_23]